MKLSIKSNLKSVAKNAEQTQKTIKSAMTSALTSTAFEARNDVKDHFNTVINKPKPRTINSVRMVGAKRLDKVHRNRSRVFIEPIAAEYLKPMMTGGYRVPSRLNTGVRGNKVWAPMLDRVNLDQYGNLTRRYVKNLKRRKRHFARTINNTYGVWRRVGRKRYPIEIVLAYRKRTGPYKQMIDFDGTVAASVARNYRRKFAAALQRRKERG